MRYLLPVFLLLSLVCFSCGGDEDVRHREVQQYAVQCTQLLVDGDAEGYARCVHDFDSLPREYRSQLVDLFAQHIHQMECQRKGLTAVRALSDTLYSDHEADVFLLYTFGDSTTERVSLPLVLTTQGWRLR